MGPERIELSSPPCKGSAKFGVLPVDYGPDFILLLK